MDRRTILKRIGAAGVGVATIGVGGAAAQRSDVEKRRVEIDGETYLLDEDVDARAVAAGTLSCCPCMDPTECMNAGCECCGPC